MLLTKLVIRILDVNDQLLGWAEAQGHARGDGALWIDDETTVVIEAAGTPMWNSVHWCDVNVEVRSQIDHPPVVVGQTIRLNWNNGPALRCGPAAGGLPPVTVKSPVSIDVMTGSLGARGMR